MNKNSILFLALLVFSSFSVSSLQGQDAASLYGSSVFMKNSLMAPLLPEEGYNAYFSISHGHCQLPMEARFTNVKIEYGEQGGMDGILIDFDLSTNSIVAAREPDGEWTQKMKSPKSFDAKSHPYIRFDCTNSYQLTKDWIQLNGTMTIKGEAQPVTLRATPIYNKAGCGRVLQKFVLNGEVNLKEFGVSEGNVGGADELARRMYMNFVIAADGC